MKYLDNLIAWGDSLFLQDTIETINEATLCYVLAANLLGPRPQSLPPRGVASAKNFLQLKQAGLDPMGDAMVELEGQFPFNLAFDPPLEPGMLVKATAAGIDIGSIVSGLNQPLGPVRSPFLIQKGLEIAAEV